MYMFSHISHNIRLASTLSGHCICVHRVYWDPTESTEPDRPPCCVSVCPLILTHPTPPFELDIKQMKWTHIPSRWAAIWKHKALMQGLSALLPHYMAEEREVGKKRQGGSPMGCYSNDRFVVKALHAISIRIHFITKEMRQSALYPKYVPSCFLNNGRPSWGLNSLSIMKHERILKMQLFGNGILIHNDKTHRKYLFRQWYPAPLGVFSHFLLWCIMPN